MPSNNKQPTTNNALLFLLAAVCLLSPTGAALSAPQSDQPAVSPVFQAVQESGDWFKAVTDSSPEFLTIPAALQNLEGEPFTVAKEAPTVDFVVYPEQVNPLVPKPFLWSLWGKGCLSSDGSFYSGIGDHGGPNGESFIYQFDPSQNAIRKVFSFDKAMGHQPGDWGYGKLHGRLDIDEDGWIYFAGYWGAFPMPNELNQRYEGGAIARYNIYAHVSEEYGSPVPGVSWPIYATDTARGLMYLLGTDDSFACYDVSAWSLRYHGSQDIQLGQRGLIVDTEKGVAYFCAKSPEGSRLAKYDPESNSVTLTKAFVPADGTLRAATDRRAADGCFYCMTMSGHLFRFDTETEEVEDLGFNFEKGHYTTTIGLSPGGRYLYYVPGAHGTCYNVRTPIVQYDIQSRQRKVLAFLEDYYEAKYDYRFGGTFGLVVSSDGSTLFIPMNGSKVSEAGDQSFGLPVLIAVHVPESERQE